MPALSEYSLVITNTAIASLAAAALIVATYDVTLPKTANALQVPVSNISSAVNSIANQAGAGFNTTHTYYTPEKGMCHPSPSATFNDDNCLGKGTEY
jgi:hypothetical protein